MPTPVDLAHQPDLSPLVKSSETVGKHLKRAQLWYTIYSLSWCNGRGLYPHSGEEFRPQVEAGFFGGL